MNPSKRPSIEHLSTSKSLEELIKSLRVIFNDLEQQLSSNPLLSTSLNGKETKKFRPGDIFASLLSDVFKIGIIQQNGKKRFFKESDLNLQVLQNRGTNFLGMITGAPLPTIAEFPNDNDWGFYHKTNATAKWYICVNFEGTFKYVELNL